MIKNSILTKKAMKVIDRKLRGEKLTQQDSNYLSRFVRPKLRDMALIDAEILLKKLEYNPKALAVERKIRKLILKIVPNVSSIIICGSAVQNNYKEYNDIDIIIATNNILTKSLRKKNELIRAMEIEGKKKNLNLDVQVYAKNSILSQYPHNPSLIYQLKDSKVIHGELKIPVKIKLNSLDLKMKLDWSEGLGIHSEASEIYYAIRNAMLVLLLMNKKIDNYQLRQNLINILGFDLFIKLKGNNASRIEKRLALNYLNSLIKYLEIELKKPKWEKIELERP